MSYRGAAVFGSLAVVAALFLWACRDRATDGR